VSRKREFWARISYVNCPEANCEYKTKVRRLLIWHLTVTHEYSVEKAREKANETGIYCPPEHTMYMREWIARGDNREKHRKAAYKHWQANREHYKSNSKTYSATHREQTRLSAKRYQEQHLEKHVASEKRYASKYPEKIVGHRIAKKIPLGSECEFCGATKKLEHGHIDYAYPDIVLTVCHLCNVWMNKGV
jgi:hypothetical protein